MSPNKMNNVKTDFSRWKDEDDMDSEVEMEAPGMMSNMPNMQNFDFSQFTGAGMNMPEFNDSDDSDDESMSLQILCSI